MRKNRIALAIFMALLAVSLAFSAPASAATQRDYVVSLIQDAGMKDVMLGATAADRDALAKSLGFFNNWNYNPTAEVTEEDIAAMDIAMEDAYVGLLDALHKQPMEPYFVNGMAQPIFYIGNNRYNDTSGEGAIRFVVYVESDLDTDGDGKLDLVKALVQLPRAALGGAKLSTIFEARPYIEGTGSQSVPSGAQTAGTTYRNANPGLTHESMYATAAPRVPAGEATTAQAAANSNFRDWYFRYSYSSSGTGSATRSNGTGSNETEFEDLNWYDYFLVRGFAVVLSPGIGAGGSDGFATCGADVEVNSFRNVIEWLTGDRKAYTDKTGNIEIKADWSNGKVGMTGRSYAGTTQFGLATSGVKGLKTVVPVAGIASWYEYTNGQGVVGSSAYSTGLAWYVASRMAFPAEWSLVSNRYFGISQLMRSEETALYANYGPHWRRRDYTVDNWFRDWGPDKIQIPMLIVHGANDDNVRPKQSIMMAEAAKKAGVDVRWIWHQGHHMTPTFPAATPNATDTHRPYSMYCGDYTYDEWLNMWFSHHLYGLGNGIMKKMPGVLALDNASGTWISYDALDLSSRRTIVLNEANRVGSTGIAMARMPIAQRVFEEPEDYSVENPLLDHTPEDAWKNKQPAGEAEGFVMPMAAAGEIGIMPLAAGDNVTLINSANGSGSWQNFLNAPTAGSTVYHFDLTEDVTVKGVVKINMRAALNTVGTAVNTTTNPPRVHAKLVEVAATGGRLSYYGGNAMGSTISVTSVAGGSWQGGGIASHRLATFTRATTGTYREIAKGWLNLCNPSSGFDSYTVGDSRITPNQNIGVFHDYTIYLQPAVHTAKAGNKLALIITTGGASATAYSGTSAFTFNIDNDATNAVVPIAVPVITVDPISEPVITITEHSDTHTFSVDASATMGAALSYQWYYNTIDSNEGGFMIVGETDSSFTPDTFKSGTYYFFCEVSAPGAESVRTEALTIVKVPQLIGVEPSASVAKLNSSKNTLTVTVVENYADGETTAFKGEFQISNGQDGNSQGGSITGTYQVGPYKVYVEVKSSKVSKIYIVDDNNPAPKPSNQNSQGNQGGNSQGGNGNSQK